MTGDLVGLIWQFMDLTRLRRRERNNSMSVVELILEVYKWKVESEMWAYKAFSA
jgi:hypothetical protein